MIIKNLNKFSGLIIAEPISNGKLIKKMKNGEELRLKRYLVIWGKYGNIPLRFKIVKVKIKYRTFESQHKENQRKEKAGYKMNPAWVLNSNKPKWIKKKK